MKKIAVFVLAVVLALNVMALPAFAVEGDGGEGGGLTPTSYDARLEIVSVNNMNPTLNATVYAGGSFVVSFRLVGTDISVGSVRASVSGGTDFSMDGSSATRYTESYDGGVINIPVKVKQSLESGRYSFDVIAEYKSGTVETTVSEKVYVNVMGAGTPEQVEPTGEGYVDLSVTSAPTGVIAAGESFEVGFSSRLINVYTNSFGNYSVVSAADGTVSVEGEGFTLAGSLAEEDISTGSETVRILCDKNSTSGRKTVTLKVSFTVEGKTYTASRSLNIDVESQSEEEEVDETKENAHFSLTSASIPEKKGRSKLSTKLTLEFKNSSVYEASNVRIRLTGFGSGSTILLDTFTDTVEVGNILPGESCKAVFPIKFDEYPIAQPNLTATVIYGTATAEASEDFTVYLQATEKEKKEEEETKQDTLRPKVIVSNFSVETDDGTGTIFSGEEFTIKVSLQNTSADKDLRNMTVKIAPSSDYSSGSSGNGTTGGGPVFSLADSTNSFYVDSFEKLSTMEFAVKFKCSASTGAGTYPVDIVFDYQYENNLTFESDNDKLTINLPVQQPIKFDLMEWTPPTECGPDGVMISFQYFNKSKNPMTALGIGVEGDFTMPTQYPGTLAAASYEYFQGTITPVDPSAVGQTKTAILFFTFEDSAGVEQRIEEKFDVTITDTSTMGGDMMGGDMMGGDMMGEGMGWDDPGMAVDPGMMGDVEYDEFGNPVSGDKVEQSRLPLWAKIAIPSAIGLAAIIVIVVIVKKVKAKKEALEDEEDE